MLQGRSSPQRTEYDEKLDVIVGYVEKYAAIAGRAITPQLLAIYIEALDDLELRQIRKGLAEYLKCGTKFPWPGDLRDYIEDEV